MMKRYFTLALILMLTVMNSKGLLIKVADIDFSQLPLVCSNEIKGEYINTADLPADCADYFEQLIQEGKLPEVSTGGTYSASKPAGELLTVSQGPLKPAASVETAAQRALQTLQAQ
jgi:hypothetical protein